MKSGLLSCVTVAALLLSAPLVHAGPTLGNKTAMPQGARYDVAYSTFSHVYLMTWDIPAVSGQFADANGMPFGARFTIATEGTAAVYTSWSTVAAGGTSADPVFLVTYLATEGNAVNKYARIVRYSGGSAIVGPRSFVASVGAAWFAANRARSLWDGDQFVVATRVLPPGFPFQTVQIQHVDAAGNVSGATQLGDGLDYYAGPTLACDPNHICLAMGFAAGTPLANPFTNAIWARLFNGQTLLPIGGVFYVDDRSVPASKPDTITVDTPQIVFNPRINKFSAVWFRARAGKAMVDFRLIGTDGQPGPIDPTKAFGPGAGDLGYDFNPNTGTAVLVTKAGANADLYALEIGDLGYYTGVNTLITPYDNSNWPTYSTQVAANPENGSWLATYMLGKAGWAAQIQGAPAAPTSNAQIYIDSPVGGFVQQPFTVQGWAADLGSASGSGADAVHIWAWPAGGGAPTFLGALAPSNARPDVGAVLGSRFTNTGYALNVSTLPPGTYSLSVYMHSTVTGTFNAVKSVDVTIASPLLTIDVPGTGATVSANGFLLGGWSIDLASTNGPGVDALHVWAFPTDGGNGGNPIFAGLATYGVARSDVGAIFGSRFTNSGYQLTISNLPPGDYDVVVYSYSLVADGFNAARFVHVKVQ